MERRNYGRNGIICNQTCDLQQNTLGENEIQSEN